jgi:hypothetical protein
MNMQQANFDIFETENEQSKKTNKALLKQGQRASSLFSLTELGNADLFNGDCYDVLRTLPSNSIDSCATDPPYHLWENKSSNNKGFMGAEWDGGGIAFDSKIWRELKRVMKPGAYLLAFGHPRTYHRMTCAIEDAGFEIKDSIMWLYGQGFPKSHDTGKAIDKKYGAERKVVGHKDRGSGRQFAEGHSGFKTGIVDITLPASDDAKHWDGWGTALKPSHEPIVLAQKPLSEKTIAENVLAWKAGAINIDDCRIGERFPSNTIISEEIAETLKDKAKYFYCPKPSQKEKNMGCENLKIISQDSISNKRTYNDRCVVCDKKFIV